MALEQEQNGYPEKLYWVLTKKNKGTIVGLFDNKPGAVKEKEILGGDKYYRISAVFLNDSVYHDE